MQNGQDGKRPRKWFVILLAAAFVAAVAGLWWSYSLAGRLTHAEAQLSATQHQNVQLATALDETNAKLRATSHKRGRRAGIRKREMRRRAENLLRRQRAAANRREQKQASTQTRMASVLSDVPGAKTDVGGVKADQTQSKGQPATDGAQRKNIQDELGAESGLIATNERELQVLRRMGNRDYYPFALRKGKKQAVATVTLELRRVNVKHSTYTMTVFSDERKIEKKNRALDEPVQFYTGKQPVLFELVVNKIGHNQVQGYISTPKMSPKPIVVGGSR